MDEKSALLDSLRLDRGTAPTTGRNRWWLGALVLAAAAGALLWLWLRPTGAPVRVATAEAMTSSGSAEQAASASILDASGYVVARRQATVASKITGRMIELDIEEGEHVKAGQVIARLDDTNIRAARDQAAAQLNFAKAALEETEVNLANAQRDYDRQKALLSGHFVSQSAVDNAQTTLDAHRAQLATQRRNVEVAARGLDLAERNLDDTVVRAPFPGVVTVKAAQPGEIVSPMSAGGGFTRTGIGTIVDMDSLEVQVDVNENFINRVEPAQRVTAKLNAYPDWQIPAHVIAVVPTADRSKGTVLVRIGLDQRDPRILPEMGVRVAFLAERPKDGTPAPAGVKVPQAAVQASGSTGVVYVVHDDMVERRAVRLGASDSEGVVVTSGLAAGERVAVGDFGRLEDRARVQVLP
jgi:RND family efflux transporter MFP subunit